MLKTDCSNAEKEGGGRSLNSLSPPVLPLTFPYLPDLGAMAHNELPIAKLQPCRPSDAHKAHYLS